ncbi:MFS transporter [Nocardiopsis gilva YIM 90087]|uniref:MFS transporter n=1 Tax=Nocardiopsis gilva YIM 90087 TaxID=1235441 RepID=A0A223S0V1_9ACTN|nr:MFS transporter [Nocardiopsis gilva]ASU81772.1 MFS transporter [Nocardiopsis gilva YIM 90087]
MERSVGEAQSEKSAPAPPTATAAQWGAVWILLLGAFMGFLDIFIVNVANPSIQVELNANFADIQMVPAGYTLAYGAGLVTGGRLGDIFGRRRVFLIGIVAFAVTSVACAVAVSPGFLIGARITQGLAAAVVLPQVLALIQVTFQRDEERTRAIGLYGAVIGVGVVAGQIVGGLLIAWDVAGLGWRSIFLVNVPLCLVTFVGALALVRDGGDRERMKLDVLGVVLLGLGLLGLVHGLVIGAEQGWSTLLVGEVVGGAVLLVLFVLWERRVAATDATPLLPPRLFKQRGFSVGLPTALFFYGTNGAFIFLLAFYLQQAKGLSPLESALTFTPMAILTSVFSVLCGNLVARYGQWVVPGGAVVMAVGLLLVWGGAVMFDDLYPAVALMPGLVLYGAGGGIVAVSLMSTALSGVEPADAGAASGGILTAIQVSEAAGVAGIGALFAGVAVGGGQVYGFAVASVVLTVLSLLTAAMLKLLSSPQKAAAAADTA